MLLPILIIFALILLLLNQFFNPGKLLFVQKRMGKDCGYFFAIKFRSMTDIKEITRPRLISTTSTMLTVPINIILEDLKAAGRLIEHEGEQMEDDRNPFK